MTDIEKFKQLLDSFGITYGTTSDNNCTTVFLTESFYTLSVGDLKVTVPAGSKGNEVKSYFGFYTSWTFFTETGKFISVGIFE